VRKLIIGCPFGNYIRCYGVTSTLGTFTRYARRTDQRTHNEPYWWAGMLWRAMTTIRYRKSLGGWTNRMGLRNPGIDSWLNSDRVYDRNHIISIHGFDAYSEQSDWRHLAKVVILQRPLAVEFNFSCPNVTDDATQAIDNARQVLMYALANRPTDTALIAKIPPVGFQGWLEMLAPLGIVAHCCNTVPCQYGGLSGLHVRAATVRALHWARQGNNFPGTIIAGGGVQSLDDVKRYVDLGADHVAVASMLFNPRKHKLLKVMRDYLNETLPKSAGCQPCPR
jgi:dihydroorotate dehydrogenase